MKEAEVMLRKNGEPVAVYSDLYEMVEGYADEMKKDLNAKYSFEFHFDNSDGEYCELTLEQLFVSYSEMGMM